MQVTSPIFGDSPCCLISGGGYLIFPIQDFGSQLSKFSLSIDLQAEATQESMILGSGTSSKTMLVLYYHTGGLKNTIRFEICDDNGLMLSATTQMSKYAAKQLFITVDAESNHINFYELNLFGTRKLSPAYTKRESPKSFSKFAHELIIGAAYIDGERKGQITMKAGNFAIFNRVLSKRIIEELCSVHKRDIDLFNGSSLYHVDENRERRGLFRDDMRKVRDWNQKLRLSGQDTRDASVVLFRWLLDNHPMLQDLANELGIQLSFPGASQTLKEYRKKTIRLKPTYLFSMVLGKRNPFGYEWVARKEFVKDLVFIIDGTPINLAAFIKFVRHKLGGAHFDAGERRRWQRQIAEMSRYYDTDRDFLNHHMKEVLTAVTEGVLEGRIEQHCLS